MYYLTFFNGKRKLVKQLESQSSAMLKGYALFNLKGKGIAVLTDENTPLVYYKVENNFPKPFEITDPQAFVKEMCFYK